MKKKFVPYEESLKLKELGFKEECFAFYNKDKELSSIEFDVYSGGNLFDLIKNHTNDIDVNTPLWQDAFEWFREQKGLYTDIFVDDDKTFGFMITYFVEEGRVDKPIQREYKSYYEAQLACIRKLIG